MHFICCSDGLTYMTSLSVLSLSNWASQGNNAFMVGRTTPFTCASTWTSCTLKFETDSIALQNPYLVQGNAYNRNTDTYTCQTSGPHLFTWSVDIEAWKQVNVKLEYFWLL